ncbi:4-phosphopantetheinyl transferase [Pelobium manganitolerans]|uniref:Holo-[acyl-carrier-protein] synthase n=1 Tax=Pelobium manganitolerans TaxID=1842495 RepID=A0A419SC38_9SPHI|nr:holo-ACP synthase [Pelobium manganitolerans]RKD20206.1 4-phosphopantetheinyl transferase [Pelobium manganitolerans]
MLSLIKEIANEKEFAIGNDVVHLPQFELSYQELFKRKVYTDKEMAYCEQFEPALLRYASTWAAKEAVYKAVKQLNPDPLAFKKIEILREKIGGKPIVNLPSNYDNLSVSLSLSHDGDYVWAVALVKENL